MRDPRLNTIAFAIMTPEAKRAYIKAEGIIINHPVTKTMAELEADGRALNAARKDMEVKKSGYTEEDDDHYSSAREKFYLEGGC